MYSGSNSLEDWKTNITLGRAEFVDLAVHQGMGDLLNQSLPTYCNQLIDKVKNYYETCRKPEKFKIVTTGHSLGGALALIAAYHYKRTQTPIISQILGINESQISVKTFTFAAPAIVDGPSQKRVEEILHKKNIYRVWNYHDPVPALTAPLAFEVGRSFPLFNINNNDFGYLDRTLVGRWGHHGAQRYLHHLQSLQTPSESVQELISILEKHFSDIQDFYTLGKDLKLLEAV